jgi:hypothetical protein
MTMYAVVELVNGCVINLARLRYCKIAYALKAAQRMKRKDSTRKLFIIEHK